MRFSKHIYILSVFLFLAFCPRLSQAELDMHVLPGFDGYHKHNRWLPLRITLASVGEDLTGEITAELQNSATGDLQIYSIPVTISKSTKKVQYLYALPESFRRNLQVRLTDNSGKTVLERDISLVTIPSEDVLVVVIARNGSGLEFLSHTPEEDAESTAESDLEPARIHLSYATIESLPDKWRGYGSVDVIVLGDVAVGALSPHQRRAITDWVYDGGRLVVSGGAHSQDLSGTFIQQLLPVKISGTRVLDSISSLWEQFDGTRMVVASSEIIDGGRAIAVADDGLPIIAERELGNGKVIFLAFDYLDPAFLAWNGKKEMWKTLLPQRAASGHFQEASIARLLVADRSLRLPSYKLVGVFLALYVLCFGPLNYIILKKSKRGRLTWITMPVISTAFIIGSLSFVYTSKSQTAMVKDFSVVNIYQDAKRVRMSSFFNLIPPTRADYRIEFPKSDGMFVNRIQSLDKEGQRNGDCKLVEKETFRMEIPRMDSVSSQLFYGESYANFNGNVSIKLSEGATGATDGEVVSNLPFDLTDCYVFSEGYRFYIGDLARGGYAQVKMEKTHAGDISDLYSTRGGEKRQFMKALEPGLPRRIPGTWLAGWLEKSALKTLAGMSMGEDYEALGMALVILHL